MKRGIGILTITEVLIEKGQATAQELAAETEMSIRMVRHELQKLVADKWVEKGNGTNKLSRKGRRELARLLDENPEPEKVIEGMVEIFTRNRKPAHRPSKSIAERKDLSGQTALPNGKTYSPADPHETTSERSCVAAKQLDKLSLRSLQKRIEELEELASERRYRIEDLQDQLHDCMARGETT